MDVTGLQTGFGQQSTPIDDEAWKPSIQRDASFMDYQWKIECFLEDLFLGGQSSIILGYRRLSVKFLP